MYKLLNNWKVVILSLGGATTFWFFNALNKDYNAVINYPIEFQFDRDSVVIMEELPSKVSIDVSSGGWNLIKNTLWFNVSPIQIELENPTEISYFTGSSLFPLVSSQLDGLEVNYLVTDTLHINIEPKKRRKTIAVIDSLKIPLEKGYFITSPISITPDTLEITGPESFTDTLRVFFDLSLAEYSEIDGSFDKSVSVILPKGSNAICDPAEVKVQFDVEEYKRVSLTLPVEMVNFPGDGSLELSTMQVDVFFHVRNSQMDDVSEEDFSVTADLATLNKQDSSVMAMLMYYPEDILNVTVLPDYIKVKNVPQ
ncbi:hypothetical protein [Marinoscillum sp. MHG1-6]|uniref:hypothetical protein n=1 Tax=Marinoscillum sp. MHG1-6 TaxID=2959627 RepID=UPI002157219A|nr:hypothetical protein [Marinoscillum sp. MHG1-6]